MSHIHTGSGQHDLTVSGYIIRTDFDEPKLLLHLHKKLHKWMQFGGHVELHENPWQALTHELLEETGYDMDQLQILQPHNRIRKLVNSKQHPVPFNLFTHPFPEEDHFHTDMGFVFVTDQEPRHAVGEDESTDIKLYTLAEIRNLVTFEDINEVGRYIFEVCLPKWESLPTSTYN